MGHKMKAFYVWDDKLIDECDRLPAVVGRASMVHNLISAYSLLDQMNVVRSIPASYQEMREFHSELYLDHLKRFINVDEEYVTSSQDEEYGIGYDCPPVSNMFNLVSTIAGGSITAAKCLVLGMADVAINWCGGWHHAQRFGAEGFCFVNDIVLAIEMLKRKFNRVLYVDLDVHHGNGVQDAYNLSKSVFTLSIHKYEPGFYPGTGGVEDIGSLTGRGYSCNVPLHASYSDDTLEYVFERVFTSVESLFPFDAAVVQCGADALAHDPHGGARLTIEGYCSCVRRVLDKRKPTILLGGGGYRHPNAARLWASLTALVAGVSLDENIPEHSHWPSYGPDYRLAIEPTLARDTNKRSYLDESISLIRVNMEKYLGNKDEAEIDVTPEHKRRKTELEADKVTVRNIKTNQEEETPNNLKETIMLNNENEETLLKPKPSLEVNTVEDIYAFVDE